MTKPILLKLQQLATRTEPFTDIDIVPGEYVMVRYATGWEVLDGDGWSLDDVESLLGEINRDWKNVIFDGDVSKNIGTDEWTLRVSACTAFGKDHPSLSIRRSPRYPIPLNKTGLPHTAKLLVQNARGLVLCTGATGSGKSTTTASLIQEINETKRAKIVTIEDPIEYLYVPKLSTIVQREVGKDTPSFYQGVRLAMRQRPDVIVIGEIRDRETADTALQAGESGHLVFATLHANSAYGAIQKLLGYFPGEVESKTISLANCLMGVINHMMVPQKGSKNCILAAELLFNHKQQVSPFLDNKEKVNEVINRSSDGISKSMASSLVELVKADKVSSSDALQAVVGQGAIYDQVKASLGI